MSIESAQAFIKRMKTDEQFAQKAVECRDAKAWAEFVEEAGFDISVDAITVEDIEEALAELTDDEPDGVTDEALLNAISKESITGKPLQFS